MQPFVLWGNRKWSSPYVVSVYVTLKEKGLPFEVRTLDLEKGEQHQTAYAQQAPMARVPSLVHGDFVLSESSAIVEYLEDTAPEVPVFPSGAKDKARARQIMSWVRSDATAPIRVARSTDYMFGMVTPTPALSDEARKACDRLFTVSRALLDGKASLFDRFTIADADLAFMLQRLIRVNDEIPADLRAYATTCFERPSIQAFLAERAAHVPRA
jgi:glutathione S-transferase